MASRILVTVLACGVGTGIAWADGPTKAGEATDPAAQVERERSALAAKADAAVAAFREACRAAHDEAALQSAVSALAAVPHVKVLAPLARFVGQRSSLLAETAITVIADVGRQLPPERRAVAVRALLPGLRWVEQDPDRAKALATALGAIADPSGVRPLVQLIGAKDGAVAAAAITAFQQLRVREGIEPIIDELVKVKTGAKGRGAWSSGTAPTNNGGTGGWAGGNAGGGSGAAGAATMSRIQAVEAAGFQTLTKLTGQCFTDALAWKAWWREHRHTFRLVGTPDATGAADTAARR